MIWGLEGLLQDLITLYFKRDNESICNILGIEYNPDYKSVIDEDRYLFTDGRYSNEMAFISDENPSIDIRIYIDIETKHVIDTLLMVTSRVIDDRNLMDCIIKNWIENTFTKTSKAVQVGECTKGKLRVGERSWNNLLEVCKVRKLNAKDGFKTAVLAFLGIGVYDNMSISGLYGCDTTIKYAEPEPYVHKNIEELKDGKVILSSNVNIDKLIEYMNIRTNKLSGKCWIWEGNTIGKGYGTSYIDGYKGWAHRISYLLKNEYIPEGLFVCHKCDNPSCINPEHLFAGTNKDNMVDAKNKGRLFTGKLIFDEEQILYIHKLFDEGLTKTKIAKKLGCCKGRVDAVFDDRVRVRIK